MALLASLVVSGCQIGMGKLLTWFVDAANGKAAKIPFMEWLTGRGMIHGDPDWAMMLIVTVGITLISIPKAVFMYFSSYLVASITNRLGADVRSEMYAHMQTLPLRFFHRSRIGDLMSRMSNDIAVIQQSSQVVVQAIYGPTMVIAGLIAMFTYSWKMSLLSLVCVPPMAIAIDRISRKIKALTRVTQESLGDVSSTIEESVRGVRIIKTFGMEQEEISKFDGVNNVSLRAALKAARRSSLVLPSAELMGGVAAALIILIGGYMIFKKEMTFGDLTGFTYLAFIVADAGKQFGRLNVTYQQVLAAGERIYEIVDTKSDLIEKPDAIEITEPLGKVEFRDVCFEYNEGENVLNKLSFTIDPGKIVAIVGPSGAGKSTIADLIPRFYDVTGGSLLVDDVDVRDLQVKSLRSMIAMVPQETILFSGTIGQNIAYGKPGASMEEIIEAANSANAHDFITAQLGGYNTVLGEGGVGLSGGQRQRIAIARALLKNPKILILDEATSSLDAASETAVQEALDRLMQGRSTLVIAHRLSTVRNADRIIVLDKGGVAESGSFAELVGSGGTFSELYRSQYRNQEAEEVV
jgi:subfamily B ATP-binding cassette protein MsbA